MTSRRSSVPSLLFALAAWLACWSAVPAFPADTGDSAQDPATEQMFKTMATRLDTGGDLYLIVNMEGMLRDAMNWVAKFVAALPATESNCCPPAAAANCCPQGSDTVAKLQTFFENSGVYALQGMGISSMPRQDGMYSLKTFFARDPDDQGRMFWRAIVGARPRRLASLDFLPADSVLARTSSGEPDQLWQFVKTGVNQVLTPAQVEAFNKFCAQASANLGVDVDKLVGSLADDSFISIQLSTTNVITIPAATGPMTMPEPSFVLGFKLNDNTVPDMLDNLLATNAIPVLKTAVGTDVLRSVMLPPTSPVRWQPAYAVHAGYLLIGSTPNIVIKAVTAFEDKNGLISTPEFAKAFEGLPLVNNGIEYVSPRFSRVITDFEAAALEAQSAAIPDGAGLNKALLDMMRNGSARSGAAATLNLQSGILVQGTSSSGGRAAVAAMAAAPLGMMAAIAIPSFVKARESAQRNACISNLRQIDAAKEQWALEQSRKDGDEVDADALKAFLRGNALPACPKGGACKINAVGTKPECSITGHSLEYKSSYK